MPLPKSFPRIALWLFIINLGVAFGAGLYESRIVVSDWLTASPGSGLHWNAEAARQDNTGVRFWAFVTTGPLTLLTVANLMAAWRAPAPVRRWWLAAALAAVVDRTVTFSYFIPTMIALMDAPDVGESVETAARWATLNHGRHAVLLIAWMAALKAFAVIHQRGGDDLDASPA